MNPDKTFQSINAGYTETNDNGLRKQCLRKRNGWFGDLYMCNDDDDDDDDDDGDEVMR